MASVRQLIDTKGSDIWVIQAGETVLDAIRIMADKDIGALVVVEGGNPVGIFTERHYARNVFLKGKRSPTTSIRETMSTPIICASPEQSVEECMAVMTNKRIRHLPVLDQGKLVGLVSIGDLVKSKIADQEFTIEQLAHYIHG